MAKDLHILSLFSGCGGMDLGFEGGFNVHRLSVKNENYIKCSAGNKQVCLVPTRFKLIFANDILAEAYNVWVHNFKKYGYSSNIYHRESIVDLVKKYRLGEFTFPQNTDIVIGGFPCQDFSVAGKRQGFKSRKDHTGKLFSSEDATEESRGKLYYWMKEVISITRPKMFVAENVKGLINLDDVKEVIQKDFSSAAEDGYIVLSPQVLHAANFGVPQSRERVFFIGLRKDALNKSALKALTAKVIPPEYDPYPTPTHVSGLHKEMDLFSPVVLRDVFSLLEEPNEATDISQKHYSRAKYMGTHCQGQKEIALDKIGPTIRSEHHGNIEFRRLSKKNGGLIDEELNAGLEERRLTPRECGMIQTFPLDFELVIAHNNSSQRGYKVSPSAAYKVVGNAVPPLLAYHLAKRLENNWSLYFE